MTLACSHCGETIEFRSARPKFCGFCGRPIDDSALATTAPGPREAPTIAHTPTQRDGPPAAPLPPPERIGGYRLIRELGRGGMGTVYEAEEAEHGRRVAVKLLAPEVTAAPEALDRFRQEGRLASSVSHPRCVFVLNADEEAGQPFIVMELMPGSTLQDRVHSAGPLSVEEAVPRILDVIEGLSEAHRLGLVHRDVKPSNCFIDGDGRVKIGDFGLSKSLTSDSHLTRTGAFLGTPLYASPEQIKGEPLDVRTDVYSVAATLYYLLAGRAPFQGTDAAATLAKIVSEPPPPIRTIRPEIPVELERIILRGLERNRDRRYRDLDEMASALLPFQPGRLQIGGLGLRAAAFTLEVHVSKVAILSLFTVGAQMNGRGGFRQSFGENTLLSAGLDFLIYLVAFFLIEPMWGASPGKWLLGLRVRGAGTTSPGPAAIFRRNLLFWGMAALPWEALAVALKLAGEAGWSWLVLPVRLLCLAAVCSTMRAANGFAGLHDLLTGTRVVVVPRLRRRRPVHARRALGRDRVVSARPVGVMKAIGPYKVRGAVKWDEGRKVLAAEDSGLGREVWVVLRPRSSPAPDSSRRQLGRATRPRWLLGGEQSEGRWDAYIAPSGCPLADLAGREGLPWRDVRPIVEDLAEELQAALRDGTLPESLSVDQLWIQPDGRAMLVDQLGPLSPKADRPGDFERARDFLREVAALALMGGRYRRGATYSAISAPVPWHARAIFDGLVGGPGTYTSFDSIRADLEATQDRPSEVDRPWRATQGAATAGVVFMPLLFALGFLFLVLSGQFATGEMLTPGGKVAIVPLRQFRGMGYLAALAFPVLFTGVSFATRGGLVLSALGCGIARRDGRRAGRLRCAWRSLLVWGPPAALLAGAVAKTPGAGPGGASAWMLYGLAVALLAAYPLLSLIDPARGPHDRLAGTALVPK